MVEVAYAKTPNLTTDLTQEVVATMTIPMLNVANIRP